LTDSNQNFLVFWILTNASTAAPNWVTLSCDGTTLIQLGDKTVSGRDIDVRILFQESQRLKQRIQISEIQLNSNRGIHCILFDAFGHQIDNWFQFSTKEPRILLSRILAFLESTQTHIQ
jgi:hypothetical protein